MSRADALWTVVYGLSALVFVYIIAMAITLPVGVVSYERDIWHHLSVYRELIAAPFNAMNPHVATDDPSRSYSPWTMSVALLARATDAGPYGAIWISAVGTIVTLLVGIFLFARTYWSHSAAPLLLLATMFGTWWAFVNHTGYHTFSTYVFSLAYPFGIVFALGFWAWWAALLAIRGEPYRWPYPVLFFLFAYVAFVTHQLQGLFLIGGTLGFVMFWGQAKLAWRAILVVSVLAGLIATKTWWYFDPVAYVLEPTVRKGHDAVRFLNYSVANLDKVLLTLGLGLFGLLGFWRWTEKRPRWELLLPFLAISAGFTLLLVRENWVSVRILPFVALYLQLGLVSYILAARIRGDFLRLPMIFALIAGLGANAYDAAWDWFRARIYLETGDIPGPARTWSPTIRQAADLAESLAPKGSTAIAQLQTAFPIEATSLAVVAIPRLFSEVPDMLTRQADNRAFFASDTDPGERCRILAKYDVTLIVWRDVWTDDALLNQLQSFGETQALGDMAMIPRPAGGWPNCSA